jgi:hypothetical protein
MRRREARAEWEVCMMVAGKSRAGTRGERAVDSDYVIVMEKVLIRYGRGAG